jgi:hypothetical protein
MKFPVYANSGKAANPRRRRTLAWPLRVCLQSTLHDTLFCISPLQTARKDGLPRDGYCSVKFARWSGIREQKLSKAQRGLRMWSLHKLLNRMKISILEISCKLMTSLRGATLLLEFYYSTAMPKLAGHL